MTRSNKSNSSDGDGFTAKNRATMQNMWKCVKKLGNKVSSLQKVFKKSQEIIVDQNAEINTLRAYLNMTNYRIDSQEQYGRREAFKVINVTDDLGDDAMQIVLDICKEIEEKAPPYQGKKIVLDIKPNDIHRCHFLGSGANKKIICKFTPFAYKKKMTIMQTKKNMRIKLQKESLNPFLLLKI